MRRCHEFKLSEDLNCAEINTFAVLIGRAIVDRVIGREFEATPLGSIDEFWTERNNKIRIFCGSCGFVRVTGTFDLCDNSMVEILDEVTGASVEVC